MAGQVFPEFQHGWRPLFFSIHFVGMSAIRILSLCLLTVCSAFHLPLSTTVARQPSRTLADSSTTVARQRSRAATPCLSEDPPEVASAPAGDAPPLAEAPQPPQESGEVEPRPFLIFDTATPGGAMGASVVVSVGFCFVVELIKAFDPNSAAQSIFK